MRTVLFVCRGNVCRSPLAEAILSTALSRAGVTGIRVRSAGVQALVGSPIDADTAKIAGKLGVDVSGHLARQLSAPDMHDADLVLASGRAERSEAVRFYPQAISSTFTIRQFGRLAAGIDLTRARDIETLIAELLEQRGLHQIANPLDDDVVDPFGRSRTLHHRAARQMIPALSLLSHALGGSGVSDHAVR